MARGQRKPIEEKIREKEELIASLKTRLQAEEKELSEMQKEKQLKELEALSEMLEEANMTVEEAREILEQHIYEDEEEESD
ncbi:MAG: hypothetical protein J1E83_00680 [Lachnospiraceae bacterium]|nr:hypothetical protein [Lachnospiraceae bacterium]